MCNNNLNSNREFTSRLAKSRDNDANNLGRYVGGHRPAQLIFITIICNFTR
jgi:hypothetical protein